LRNSHASCFDPWIRNLTPLLLKPSRIVSTVIMTICSPPPTNSFMPKSPHICSGESSLTKSSLSHNSALTPTVTHVLLTHLNLTPPNANMPSNTLTSVATTTANTTPTHNKMPHGEQPQRSEHLNSSGIEFLEKGMMSRSDIAMPGLSFFFLASCFTRLSPPR